MENKFIPIPHIGNVLVEEFLEPLNISQNALALAINVPTVFLFRKFFLKRKDLRTLLTGRSNSENEFSPCCKITNSMKYYHRQFEIFRHIKK